MKKRLLNEAIVLGVVQEYTALSFFLFFSFSLSSLAGSKLTGKLEYRRREGGKVEGSRRSATKLIEY